MAKCHFRLKSGADCGITTEGKKHKCKDHYTVRCSVCGNTAWQNCVHGDCDAVLCRTVVCKAKHEQIAHPDGVEALEEQPDIPTDGQRAKPEAPDTISIDASPCPACEGEAHAETRRKGHGSGHQAWTSRARAYGSTSRTANPWGYHIWPDRIRLDLALFVPPVCSPF